MLRISRLFLFAVLVCMLAGTQGMAAPSGVTIVTLDKSQPVLFGVSDLEKELAASKASGVRIVVSTGSKGEAAEALSAKRVSVPKKPESFVIARSGKTITVVGSDQTGTMYGLFELAERLKLDGSKALTLEKPVVQSPYVEFRAVNPFINLPYGDEKDWWFLQEDFWKGYIDQLARARINWIDLHGMYDIKSTHFPNIYPYFIKSDKFPEAGAPPEVADRNLAMLKKVMRMAKDRGIKFAMMSYSASWNGPGLRQSPYEGSEENLAQYTREVVRKMIQSCPDLAMIGFRIGESGKSGDFFRKSYIPAIKEAGRKIDLYTRTWGASKQDIMEIGREFPGRLYIEIKYNGEQYGPAHMVTGDRMAGWRDYSYQDYLTHPQAYKIIWQIRQNGTHRVFPWGNPDFTALSARNSHIGGAVGFCTEPVNAYYPAHDYLHEADSPCKWYKWVYQRDWFFYNVWGRMSYDPNVPERVWIKKFKDRYGANVGETFYKAFKKASEIIPYAFTCYSLGPDHRNHAPELETGGHVKDWSEIGGFDDSLVQCPREFADRVAYETLAALPPDSPYAKFANKLAPTARLTPIQCADMLSGLSRDTMKYLEQAQKIGSSSKEFKCLTSDIEALANLADYYALRLRSAANFSLYRVTRVPEFANATRQYHAQAVTQWTALAAIGDEHYRPFVDTLKLKTEHFRWTEEGKNLEKELSPMDDLKAESSAPMSISLDALQPKGDRTGPKVKVENTSLIPAAPGVKMLTVRVKAEDPAGVGAVMLKYKPMPSESFWRYIDMKLENGLWTGSVQVTSYGLLWAIEALDKDGNGTMWPDFRNDIPYRVVEAWKDPACFEPSVEQALAKLTAPGASNRYSMMLIGKMADKFNEVSPKTKAQILEAVKNGVSLVIDQQDFTKFDISWLPGNIKVGPGVEEVKIDTTHPICKGMKDTIKGRSFATFTADDPEWKALCSPNGMMYRKYGEGYIVLSQLKRRDRPYDEIVQPYLSNLVTFLNGGRTDKAAVVLDQGDWSLARMLMATNIPIVFCGE